MAELPCARGVRGSGGGTFSQDLGVIGLQEDLLDMVETGDALFSRYEQTGDIGFLNEAIVIAERAIPTIAPFHHNRVMLLAKLRKMFGSKFERTRDVADLDMAWVWGMDEMDRTAQRATNFATACSSILGIRRELESAYFWCRLPARNLFRRYESWVT